MPNEVKNWLVRTRSGEILGPYSQRELMMNLKGMAFSPQDEIAPSQGHWISAQTLLNHETDEFTRTSTRNFTVTHATAKGTSSGVEITNTQKIITEDHIPIPEVIQPPADPPIKRATPASPPKKISSGAGPIIAGLLGVAGLWILANYLRPKEIPKPFPRAIEATKKSDSAKNRIRSPFVTEIYRLMRAGQGATALEKLNKYHEKKATPGEMEYLIPFSALLITEGESPARARKFLNRILTISQDKKYKAQAHQWLGYLMLSQDERDMGEDHFLEALQLNPKSASARFNLGRVYLKQNRNKQALKFLRMAELAMPNLWLIHMYKGRAKTALGRWEEARSSFKKAIELSRDRWITYLYYALFLEKRQMLSRAREQLRIMLRRDPSYEINSPPQIGFFQDRVNYAAYLGVYNKMMTGSGGEEREMGKLYLSYLLNGPNSAEAKRIEAVAQKKGGLFPKMLALKVALDRNDPSPKLNKALKRLPAKIAPFGYYGYILRGAAKMQLRDYSGARTDFSRALTLEPLSAVSQWANVTLLKRQSRHPEAREKIRTLLTHHPNFIPAIRTAENF